MPSFLQTLANYLVTKYPDAIGELTLVLPNRRAGLFFRRFLSGRLSGTSWSPHIFSIEDFTLQASGLILAEPADCLISLYEVHREMMKEKAESFDAFLSWGPQLLSDFNEVDRYLINPSRLFTYLDEVRAMTVWNPDGKPLTGFQQNYLRFYRSMLPYYEGLAARLQGAGQGTSGMIYRKAWENLSEAKTVLPWKKLIFAGFNALTTAEEKIIGYLTDRGIAEVLWDADRYYVDDPNQEAGLFLRTWFRQWPDSRDHWVFDDLSGGKKTIRVMGVPGLTGQVKFCGELLSELPAEALNEHTAIVLPDETLLIPLLNAIPGNVSDVNITMGLPLSQTPLATLFLQLLEMHNRAVTMAGTSGRPVRFHSRDLLHILRHPYASRFFPPAPGNTGTLMTTWQERIRSRNLVFLSVAELRTLHEEVTGSVTGFPEALFEPWQTVTGALDGMRTLLEILVESVGRESVSGSREGTAGPASSPDDDPQPAVELEYAWAVTKVISQLSRLIAMAGDHFTRDTLLRFLRELFGQTKIPFYGEPLKGLQIMGMLESRNLDFDRVILLSCNEGILPSGRQPHSFIPFDVRREYGLPLFSHKEAVYAYHFYRLIQRAGEVWLLYNTESDNLGGGEPSRFIKQITVELPDYNPGIGIREAVLTVPVAKESVSGKITMEKTPEVMAVLKAKAVTGFAPTALNAYRNCQLRFYFSEVAALKQPEEREEEIDPRILGSVIHQALHRLYLPYEGRILSVEGLKEMTDKATPAVMEAFGELFHGDAITAGKNLLLTEVARMMIGRFLEGERKWIDALGQTGEGLTITGLEKLLEKQLSVAVTGETIQVKIKGTVDRIDRHGRVIRLIDYKTGSVKTSQLKIKSWEDLPTNPSLDKGFQLLTYAWLLGTGTPGEALTAGIIPLKQHGSGWIPVMIPGSDKESSLPEISTGDLNMVESCLTTLLSEIFDSAKPFVQVDDPGVCKYCPFADYCQR